ncbi:MAG: endonuclease domain-containing protein [Solirubrobacterales bacterium]
MARIPPEIKARSRSLRTNPTEAETALWRLLREPPFDQYRFRRQHPVPPYIVDFACVSAQVVLEADGGQHVGSEHDARRDAFLRDAGWRVLRLWNHDVLGNPEGVREVVFAFLSDAGPHPNPPPRSARGREP